MDNDIKTLAQKELMRRAAMKELERRKASPQPQQQAQPTQAEYLSQLAPTMAGMRAGLQTIDDGVRGAANGLTFGMADRFAGFMGGEGTDAERAKSAQAQERSPVAYTGGEIGGAIAGLGKLQGAGLTASRFLPQAATGIPKMLGLGTAGAVDGLLINEAMNAGYGRDFGENAGLAAGLGAAAPAIGAGISKVGSKALGMFNKAPKIPIPTADEIRAASQAAYKNAEAEGVIFNQTGVEKLRQSIIDGLTKKGFDPVNEPGVMPVLNRLEQMQGGNVTLEGLDTLRKVAANGWRPGLKSNNSRIGEIINSIDDLVDNADPATILTGRGDKAAAALKDARSNWHKARKLDTIESHLQKGEDIANAQVNADVSGVTKRQLRQILTSEGKRRGFTPDEMTALRSAAGHTPGQRVLHAFSGLLPRDKLSAGLQAIGGLATGGASLPLQAAGMAVGYGAGKAKDVLAKKSIDELMKLVASGGNAAAIQAPKNAAQKALEAKKDMIVRLLLGAGLTQGPAMLAQ